MWCSDLDKQTRVFQSPIPFPIFHKGLSKFLALVFSPHPFKSIHQFLVTFAFACPGVQCDLNFVQTEDGKTSSANAAPRLFFCIKYSLNIILSVVYTNSFRKWTSCSKMSFGCWVACRPGITNTSCMTRNKQSSTQELEHQI